MPREVPEWIGSSPDAKIPTRVKLRIMARENNRCWISGRVIRPGDLFDFDHKVALINGGEHRESNLFPALRDKHREKTKQDVAEKSKTARVRARHVLPREPSRLRSRGFEPRPKQHSATRPLKQKERKT